MTPTNKEMICALDKDTKMAVAQYLRSAIVEESKRIREQVMTNKQIGYDYAKKGDMEKFREYVVRNDTMDDMIEISFRKIEIKFCEMIFHEKEE